MKTETNTSLISFCFFSVLSVFFSFLSNRPRQRHVCAPSDVNFSALRGHRRRLEKTTAAFSASHWSPVPHPNQGSNGALESLARHTSRRSAAMTGLFSALVRGQPSLAVPLDPRCMASPSLLYTTTHHPDIPPCSLQSGVTATESVHKNVQRHVTMCDATSTDPSWGMSRK